MPEFIDRSEGRRLCSGSNPEGYDDARPQYPDTIYQIHDRARGAATRGSATLEIGAGSGLATRRLIECGADPITVVEPDERFAPQLQSLAARREGAELRLRAERVRGCRRCRRKVSTSSRRRRRFTGSIRTSRSARSRACSSRAVTRRCGGTCSGISIETIRSTTRRLPLLARPRRQSVGCPGRDPIRARSRGARSAVRAAAENSARSSTRNTLDADVEHAAGRATVRRLFAYPAAAATRARRAA